MSGYIFAVVLCVLLVASLVQLLRSRRIREKYVAIWILVALGVIVLGAFPALAGAVARLVGVVLPVNLVFATSLAVLLFVCVQLSVSMSSTEEKTRTLTEEVALLRLQVEQMAAERAGWPEVAPAEPQLLPTAETEEAAARGE
ncbi:MULTISPECIES: DUF2304 domain-containing protein [Cellulosimicrobium]|uniref:DUF2304 domain-containing protein n=1 Tax=Cellulosimicrobium TaxID=157920 RepID=UPI00119C9915|nr:MULTISPECIES: DUF2304 domain-containing protein [Cellulosimicrobium]MBE9937730.1 DUF2304 family protein [Cellulosimicrobium cellulans]